MPTTDPHTRCVLGDWGTSRLRLFLVEAGRIVDSRQGPGIAALSCAPADVLLEHVGAWVDRSRPLDVFLAGMVGSRNGLHEGALRVATRNQHGMVAGLVVRLSWPSERHDCGRVVLDERRARR